MRKVFFYCFGEELFRDLEIARFLFFKRRLFLLCNNLRHCVSSLVVLAHSKQTQIMTCEATCVVVLISGFIM